MYKLIVSDLDESLLGDTGNISKADLDTIHQLRRRGVKFVPNTGRGFKSVQPLLKQIGTIDQANEYVISYNGGVIVENQHNHVLSSHYLSHSIAEQIYQLARFQPDLGVHIYTLNDVYTFNIDTDERNYIDSRNVTTTDFDQPNLDIFQQQPIVKMLVSNLSHDKLTTFQQQVLTAISVPLSLSFSSNRYLEFNPANVNKGKAVLELGQTLKIEPNEIITIGDNHNDLTMIEAAGMGVAVNNSIPAIKKAAQLTLDATNNDNPITEIYRRLFVNEFK
ncbi:Cof-type HAD-IIB family hydrolase [Paucilactobacillus kaifaensis]|uniref:Cof-type HAD-IIB family hydrolase n=1 Tax=Paucilactobacillus kaifaensis TaxID=2559921 RepID=UPI0010F50C81|nr:Cof-type HAD-IIB family hydrolase [Paucilactobacillus kaifaensis]